MRYLKYYESNKIEDIVDLIFVELNDLGFKSITAYNPKVGDENKPIINNKGQKCQFELVFYQLGKSGFTINGDSVDLFSLECVIEPLKTFVNYCTYYDMDHRIRVGSRTCSFDIQYILQNDSATINDITQDNVENIEAFYSKENIVDCSQVRYVAVQVFK